MGATTTRRAAGVAPQGNRACFENFRVRGNFCQGNASRAGKRPPPWPLDRERLVKELHRCGKSFRARARCDDDHNGPAKFRGDLSSDQSLGSIGESGHMLTRDFMAQRRDAKPKSRLRERDAGSPTPEFRDRR